MRITNSMLNRTSSESGMPLNGSSLLNYIDNNSSVDDLLSTAKSDKANQGTGNKSAYEKLEALAEKLTGKALEFALQGKDSLFAEAKESGSNEKIWERAEELVKSYNSLLKEMGGNSSELEKYYKKMLIEGSEGSKEELAQIGITLEKDGTLKVDREKLKAADLDTLEKVLGRKGGFSVTTALIAGKIAEQAQANMESLSSRYDASGKSWSAAANKYDFWG